MKRRNQKRGTIELHGSSMNLTAAEGSHWETADGKLMLRQGTKTKTITITGAENSEHSEDWEHSGITRKQSRGHDVKMARDEMKCYAGTSKAGSIHLS